MPPVKAKQPKKKLVLDDETTEAILELLAEQKKRRERKRKGVITFTISCTCCPIHSYQGFTD
jgi:hypothetical protein